MHSPIIANLAALHRNDTELREEDVVVDAIVIQKNGEALHLKGRQLLIDRARKCIQLMSLDSKRVDKRFGVEQLRSIKVKRRRLLINERMLMIELKGRDSCDVELHLSFSPPHDTSVNLVAALINEMIGAAPVIPGRTNRMERVPVASQTFDSTSVDIITDFSVCSRNGTEVQINSCRLVLDRSNHTIRFQAPSSQIFEYSITQFLNRTQKVIKDESKPVTLTLQFNQMQRHCLRIHLKPPHSRFAKKVREQIIQMFEENNEKSQQMFPTSSFPRRILPALKNNPEVRVDLAIIGTPYSVTRMAGQRFLLARGTQLMQFESPEGEVRTFNGRQMVNWWTNHSVLYIQFYDENKGTASRTQLNVRFRSGDQTMAPNVADTLNWMLQLNNKQAHPPSAPSRKRPRASD